MLPEERFDSEETAADYHEVSFHNAVGSHDKDIRLMFRGGWRFGWGKYSVVDDLHPYSWCYNNPGLVKASEKGSQRHQADNTCDESSLSRGQHMVPKVGRETYRDPIANMPANPTFC